MPGHLDITALSTRLNDAERSFALDLRGLRLMQGHVLAVTGASGSGKTLFLELLSLLRAPGPGAAYVWQASPRSPGQDLAGLWARGPRDARLAQLRGRLFGFVPQSGGLIPSLDVLENVTLTQRITRRPDAAHARHLLDRLGLAPVARLRPAALSIGQRQRVAIARALAHRPAFVIADEPTAALDPPAADAAMALLLEMTRADGAGLILSSHDLARLDRLGLDRLHFTARAQGPGQILSTAEVRSC